MDELLEILEDLNPDIDYETATTLVDDRLLDSLSIVTLVSEISETFDIDLGPKYLIPENFNSVSAMWDMIQRIQEDE